MRASARGGGSGGSGGGWEGAARCRCALALALNAPTEDLAAGFREAGLSDSCRGFAAGRTIWQEPSRDWLAGRIGDAELIARVRASFETLIRAWRSSRERRKEATA